ncbi:hypothetical protein BGU62_19635 [Clostridioides difficile]|nr:hypothetical protein BGU62_19635 [Clostridioides difficile]
MLGSTLSGLVGGFETRAPVLAGPALGYHPCSTGTLTIGHESGLWTLSGGQFDWGGRLPKGNGGAQRFAQYGRKSYVECKGQ